LEADHRPVRREVWQHALRRLLDLGRLRREQDVVERRAALLDLTHRAASHRAWARFAADAEAMAVDRGGDQGVLREGGDVGALLEEVRGDDAADATAADDEQTWALGRRKARGHALE